jgi:alkylhydroperoxidase family enzyme
MPKTEMSRFPIHDDLTAPEGSLPILKGASSAAGQLPNFLGVLAGAPAALKAYTRFRAELRHGALPRHSAERIGLAVAEHYGSKPGLQLHTRTSRQAGLGIDEVARATRWDSGDAAEAALLRYVRPLLGDRANFPQHLHEEAREAGWSDQQLLEAIAVLSMESFTAMVNVAGDVPVDGSVEETRVLRAA